MKILIVDDEELTRTGVISSVNWKALGIDQIFQADDGQKGLEIARREAPEIILSDVRMPRMDGIDMLEQISEFLPDTTVIFMSGYSDKAYLKAAIKLKAVNYIEKPINRVEIESTLRDAVTLYSHKLHSQRVAALHHKETGFQLAHLLTESDIRHRGKIEGMLEDLGLPAREVSECQTFLIQLERSLEMDLSIFDDTLKDLETMFKDQPVHILYELRRQQYLVFMFLSPAALTEHSLLAAKQYLQQKLAGFTSHFYITAGDAHQTQKESHVSYEEAVILMQYCFFFPEGTFLSSHTLETVSPKDSSEALPSDVDFYSVLDHGTQEQAKELLDVLYLHFFKNCSCLPNFTKDLYYRLLNSLENARVQHQLLAGSGGESALSIIEQCFSYGELHEKLLQLTFAYFQELEEHSEENSTILMIKNYIGENYMKDTLSVKEISNHVFLSTSYVCTFFKNETGKTLNQYLTEYRMEKAKQLLDDPRYRISDISSKVGYSDGNYFGKSFKKYTGISPSEYRERKA